MVKKKDEDIKKKNPVTASREMFSLCSSHNIRYPKGARCPKCVNEAKKK